MESKNKVVGIILAGGQSKRYGEPKAFALKRGKYFYQYALHALQQCIEQTIIIAHPTLIKKFSSLEKAVVIEDDKRYRGFGPMAGLFSAMEAEEAVWYIVLPIDTPFITPSTINKLLAAAEEGYEAIIPLIDGRDQPLIAMYHQKTKTKIEELLKKKNLSMHGLLQQISVKYVEGLDEREFININKKSDYIKYIRQE
ncbi:molybdenum cofactor guanylyltransferase [Niallia sp. NCCP-28]|uniref:molybdenum cofactor guanylyltransferase n=1 Tax=Niallia sp. NCCP-28 TaxID=2934712 RepID=UPI00208A812B|nr:molybdenum cofactor guanylyltransferase [Niallia sp. NCCP-28]GKU84537.1 putative molybdenum cofactor guanylyltransferase [Niallia sp. NCCP-28]